MNDENQSLPARFDAIPDFPNLPTMLSDSASPKAVRRISSRVNGTICSFMRLLLLLLKDLYSALGRIKHESERCDGAEPS